MSSLDAATATATATTDDLPTSALLANTDTAGNHTPTTIPTQHPQLFPKPHPVILPTSSGNEAAHPVAMEIATDSGAIATATAGTAIMASANHNYGTNTNTNHNHNEPLITDLSTPLHHHFAQGAGVKEPRPTDVICGRGKMTASHPANRRFRELVDSHKASYQNSKRRDEKTRITCELVDKLRGEGRFVLFDPTTKLWHEVSEEYAREKVSHSLRSRSSSAEQRNATNASNSFRILNDSAHHDNDTMVDIAPRTGGVHGGNGSSNKMSSVVVERTSSAANKIPSDASIPSAPHKINAKTKPNTKSYLPDTAPSNPGSSSSSSNPGSNISGSKSKTAAGALHTRKLPTAKATVHKAASPSPSVRSKHSVLRPGLDEIVRRLIRDQQALLRAMIHKETERFTSAAAMGPPPRPMPLSYKAEASAVSTLTASLPKMGTPVEGPVPWSMAVAAAAGATEGASPAEVPSAALASDGSSASESAAPNDTHSFATTTATVLI